jgi:superfamily II DNA or RNA helicase
MLTRRGILVKGLSPKEQAALTVEVTSDYSAVSSFSKKVKCFRPCKPDGHYLVPAFYQPFDTVSSSIETIDPFSDNCSFQGVLNEPQLKVYDKAVHHLTEHRGGFLCLPTGFGKTVLAIALMAHFRVKTLIIVHKDMLMKQWTERIHTFLPNARIGTLQGETIDVKDKDIVLGMIQSLSLKEYPLDVFQGFGMTIIDEAHHCPAEKFSSIFFKANCKYMVGLTATPNRKDGLHTLYKWFVGDIIVHLQNEVTSVVTVRGEPYWESAFTKPEPLTRTGEINMSAMVTGVTILSERNRFLTRVICELANTGRQILVLSDRRVHCETLHQAVSERGVQSGLYIGGMKQEEYAHSAACQVIIATFSLVAEGFDIPRLDTLVLASPKSDVIQAAGRILRHGGLRKHEPLIVDVQDQYSIFYSQARKRKTFYKQAGFVLAEEECLVK